MTGEYSSHDRLTDVLICLSRITFSDEEKRLIEALCPDVNDWPRFTDLAIKHGVAALVWQNLIDLGLDKLVSDTERQILEGARLRTIARVTYITTVATEVITGLEKKGIRALLLKGLALEHSVYGSRGLRQMSDADILVSCNDVLRARDILESMGFISDPLKSPLYRHILLDLGHHLPELRRGGVSVDLHYRLFGPEDKSMTEKAIQAPVSITAGGRSCFVLLPEVAFLGMIRHLSKHEIKGEFQLRLYNDLYFLLRDKKSDILTHRLRQDAEKTGIMTETDRVLCIMKHVYNLSISDEFFEGSNKDVFVREFMNNMVTPFHSKEPDQREQYIKALRSVTGLTHRLIFIAGDIFPSIAFMKKRYGCHTLIGCLPFYPHRFGKLIWIFRSLLSF